MPCSRDGTSPMAFAPLNSTDTGSAIVESQGVTLLVLRHMFTSRVSMICANKPHQLVFNSYSPRINSLQYSALALISIPVKIVTSKPAWIMERRDRPLTAPNPKIPYIATTEIQTPTKPIATARRTASKSRHPFPLHPSNKISARPLPPPNNQDNEKHRPNTTPPTPKRRFKCFTRHRDRDGRTDGLVLARRRASSTCNDILRRTAYTPSSSLDNASHAVEDLCGLEYIQQPWLECRERGYHIYKIPAKAVCLSDILINDMTGNNNHHDFHLMHAT
ncbi:hypothetical protein E6O75_ATG06890 [Venturia nashicola]|uniref:Uncharacterized protein n=1 Tax=Venturia nashicola TaxID=86259 RepID=A0A4Z1NWR6_9PEZI|nr:hypothetical protein E6O75_ATG06890 [Venturia nashicola]